MKEFNTEQLLSWTKGENLEEKIYFIIIKMPNCPKCEHLANNANKAFGELKDNIGFYIYKPVPNANQVAEIISKLDIMSAPSIIFKYKNDSWDLGKISWSDQDYTDLRCIFDAINDNDQSFFGYSEFDEKIEDDAQYNMNRLLRLVHGEINPDILKERKLLKKEVTK